MTQPSPSSTARRGIDVVGYAGIAVVFYVFGVTLLSALLSKTLLDGETSLLTNPLIDFARRRVWDYPMHAQDIFFPGVKPFMIHPPLHYFIGSLLISAFGFGPWQFLLVSAVVGFIGIAIAAYVAIRIWGLPTAIVTLAITTSLFGFYYSATQLRCDITFGFSYALFLLVFGRTLFVDLSRRATRIHSFLIGAVAIMTLASHWFGYFVQLYVVAYAVIVVVRRRDVVVNLGCVVAGIVVAFVPWAALYGRDLWKALVFALVQGDQFRSTVHGTMRFFLYFVTQWPGGRILEVGVLLAITVTALRLAPVARNGPRRVFAALPLPLKVEVYLLANLALFVGWFAVFVGNKAPQYGGDLYFFADVISARGFVGAGELVADRLRIAPFLPIAAVAFALLVVGTSTVVHDYFPGNPLALRSSDRVYDEVRSSLTTYVNKDATVVMGIDAYPYLYDRPYVSPMRLVGSFFLKPQKDKPFLTILRRALRQRRLYDPLGIAPADLAARLPPRAQVMVTNDDGEGYQNFFYDPRVWGRRYDLTAVVAVDRPDVGHRQPSTLTPGLGIGNFFAVFNRRDRATPRVDRLTRRSHITVISMTRLDADSLPVSRAEWTRFSPEAKRARVVAYLDGHHWFGLAAGASRRRRIVDAIVSPVDTILSSVQPTIGFGRSLGEAVIGSLQLTGSFAQWDQ